MFSLKKKRSISLVLVFSLSISLLCGAAAATSVESSPTGNPDDITNVIFNTVPEAESSAAVAADVEEETVVTDSPTNGEGRIDNVIVIDSEVMPLGNYTDIEVPANTAVFFASEYLTQITMSVEYMPSNLDLYYGIGTKSDGTGNHWANKATGGSGSVVIAPGTTKSYYPYLANGNSKVMYVDFSYYAIASIGTDANDMESVMAMAASSQEMIGTVVEEVPLATNSISGSAVSGSHEVIIEGEPGDVIAVGDLVFEIIDPEEMEALASQPVPYGSTTRWTNVSLSGTEMSKKFEVTASYPYAKVWISNQGKGDIKFTMTRGSDTGTLVSGSDVTIKAGTSTSVYSTNAWPADDYYANFTCGSANMQGLTSCRVASTQHELDI